MVLLEETKTGLWKQEPRAGGSCHGNGVGSGRKLMNPKLREYLKLRQLQRKWAHGAQVLL